MKINDVREKLKSEYSEYKDSCKNLTEDQFIKSEKTVYNFDKIKDFYCKKLKICSADALHIGKNNIFLIEFKRGFADKSYNIDDKAWKKGTHCCEECIGCINIKSDTKKESLQLAIRLKAYESLSLLEKIIFEGNDIKDIPKEYVVVIDSKMNALDAICDIQKSLSEITYDKIEKDNMFNDLVTNSLLIYRKEIDSRHIFYNNVTILYDFEFDSWIEKK